MNLSECQMYFVPVVLAIIFGEVLFQSAHHMASKWGNDLNGYLVCLEHTVLYTAVTVFFLYLFCALNPINLVLISSIAIGHYIIDKFPLTHYWMRYVRCEHNPVQTYFMEKVGKDRVGSNEWFSYIESGPTLELNEDYMTSYMYYVSEILLTSRLLHFAITFFTVVVLDILDYI